MFGTFTAIITAFNYIVDGIKLVYGFVMSYLRQKEITQELDKAQKVHDDITNAKTKEDLANAAKEAEDLFKSNSP